jgi:hypothetical protein
MLQQRIREKEDAELKALHEAELKALQVKIEHLQRDNERLTSAQTAKRQCTPLHKPQEDVFDTDVLVKQILEFVGPNEYFFSASISRRCRQMQTMLSHRDAAARDLTKNKLRTSSTAALASPAKLLWAFDSGLKQKTQYKKPVRLLQATMQASADPVSVLALLEVQSFKAKDAYDGVKLCAAAAKRGDVQLLKWLREHGCAWDGMTCRWAALKGRLDILIWAHENGCEWDNGTCWCAAQTWSLAHTAVGACAGVSL